MALKNYMEDVVTDVADIMLKDADESGITLSMRRDIIAYSLNRLTPKYIVSGRGFVHSIIQEEKNPNLMANIINVVKEGIDVITSRKREYSDDEKVTKDLGPFLYDGHMYFNFPHFIGEVADQAALESIEGVKVTLFMNDKTCDMAEASWPNPYITNKVTAKYYSFWPSSVKLEKDEESESSFTFRIRFEHPDYYPFEREVILLINAEDRKYKYIRRNYTETIDLSALERKDKK
jgi:competence protein ComFB